MHDQREFPISSAASDLWICWAGRAHAVAPTAFETQFRLTLSPGAAHIEARALTETASQLSVDVGCKPAIDAARCQCICRTHHVTITSTKLALSGTSCCPTSSS